MKKIILFASLLCALCMIQSCTKEKVNDHSYGIDPATEPDMLNKAFRINGQLRDGKMPSSITLGGNSIAVSNLFDIFEVSGGTVLSLPISTNADSTICKIYIQAKGADSYWEVPVTRDTFGGLSIEIFIPNFVANNHFNLNISVGDCNGNISAIVGTEISITNTPVLIQGAAGTPRFNLQFSSKHVDFDLHVVTPNGTEIYYHNPTGDNGQLDVDCICCDRPDENIYWEPGTATPGVYKYWVHFYGACGDVSSNYLLRVMNNTTVVQMHTGTLSSVYGDSPIYTYTVQ